MFTITQGTKGKLITLNPNEDAKVEDWVVRKDIDFEACLISPQVVIAKSIAKTIAGKLASEGYALFGGESGGDRQARYVLAVLYTDIKVTP